MTLAESQCVFFFKQKTAYEMRISDWSSDVCSSDLADGAAGELRTARHPRPLRRPLSGALRRTRLCPVRRGGQAHRRQRGGGGPSEIGRASCRERVCQYV